MRLLITAAHKSSGKTTVSLGLCRTLRTRGHVVQPFKKGPDYIDPMWLGQAAGRPCHNLDFYTMETREIDRVFSARSQGAAISLVEGNKGLYDGLDLDGSNSNAALARQLRCPVILVIDARGMTRGIAPMILGYQAFDPEVNIAGVILNKLGGSRHESKLRAVIEHYTDVPVLGAVHRAPELELTERHLGLIPSNETAQAEALIQGIAARIEQALDIDRLLEIAAAAPPLPEPAQQPGIGYSRDERVRIAIARDQAFGFYYPGDLEALEQAGAELLPFDTLHDRQLPDADALFIGGGFPESRMTELEANHEMRENVRSAIEAGMPAYAECGGLMYLTRSLSWNGRRCAMAGVIAADSVMEERPQGRGYIRLVRTLDHPWSSAQDAVDEVHGHEFHYSRLENLAPDTRFAWKVERGHGVDGSHDGIVYRNLLASYSHLRDTDRHHWANQFVTFIKQHKTG